MSINIELELAVINNQLKKSDGYLACEQVIIGNMKKQLASGYDFLDIQEYLHKLLRYFKEYISKNGNAADCTNYRYVEGFIKNMIDSPYWYSWIRNANI